MELNGKHAAIEVVSLLSELMLQFAMNFGFIFKSLIFGKERAWKIFMNPKETAMDNRI